MKIIARQQYIEHIQKFIGKGMIIALTGQRRVGKSYIIRQLVTEIEAGNPDANIIYINKEKTKYADIRNAEDLSRYLDGKLKEGADNYLLIDEVQDISGFENVLRSLNADEECQIVVTGSNAKMLSSELSTYLGGRYIEIHILSLSYREFLTFHNLNDSDDSLLKYLGFGGLPHLYRLGLENEDMVWEYIQNIYNTIVLKDVVQREGLRNVTLFENLMSYVSDNAGQLVSATSLSKYLKSQRVELTPLSAINYLKAASNAYIINKVPRYDIHGKRLLETNDKYYFEDLGLRNMLAGQNRTGDIEKVIENAVYLHLKNLGYKISVGTLPNGEIDFVAEKGGTSVYIQVAYLIADDKTKEREFGNLLKIQDNYPKYVISMNPMLRPQNYEGIKHLTLRQSLMSDSL
ncbi:ATP-binding protein [Muribaculum intestinale]|uniref:ATP-binding protein n=4 Tax=Muribaculum intestinale TaxID=1796646 RepID=UPI0025AE02F9|nr:ATP-binding protein [Muribaculum intestinale]